MISKYINDIELLKFNSFPDESLFHFSTTISGGCSEGAYESFNLGFYSGDAPIDVFNNRIYLSQIAGVRLENLFVPYQTHDDKVYVIDQGFLSLPNQEQIQQLNGIDAIITAQKGVCIGVTTADCVPLLIFDPSKRILAAVHAGWKGTVARIASKTVAEMISRFGCLVNDLLVGVAPSISPEIFEVGDEVGEAFKTAGFDLSEISFRNTETGKLHIDLRQANKLQLLDVGVSESNIEITNLCTYSNPEKFFSARRQTIHSGRMLTGGVIR